MTHFIHAFFYISGIVFWVSIATCCLMLVLLRRNDDLPEDTIIYEKELKAVRSKKTKDKKFTLTLEQYLDGEAKATQYTQTEQDEPTNYLGRASK